MKTLKLSLVLALVLLPMSAFADWTGAPSTGMIDESSAGIYSLDVASLGYNSSGSTTTIVSRLNVTDITGTGFPSWTTMEIRGYDPGASSQVRAKLFRVSAGTISNLATCQLTDNSMVSTSTCSIPSLDFTAGYMYVVQIEVSRTSTSVSPFINGVRIY